ncbi:MAG: rhomboid family intramembrane serine protease [Allosphingosinicella sp.]|uniref:rhomboid family intramembrane serine protease n=1 Tax=Allosphingosinicella sp. TaxID=2823234 RepID=UPI003942E39D
MRPPDSWRGARATLAIGGATILAYLIVALFGLYTWSILWGGFIPLRAAVDGAPGAPFLLTPLTATLVHAGTFHLIFNMLIHFFCGRPVEGVLGPAAFLILYVGGAYMAAGVHYALNPLDHVPMVGASGAVSAVLGAYAMLFGRNKVKVADPRLATWLNALWLMAAWVALQVILGIVFGTAGIQVAIGAHIGGFLLGLLLANPLLLWRYRGA